MSGKQHESTVYDVSACAQAQTHNLSPRSYLGNEWFLQWWRLYSRAMMAGDRHLATDWPPGSHVMTTSSISTVDKHSQRWQARTGQPVRLVRRAALIITVDGPPPPTLHQRRLQTSKNEVYFCPRINTSPRWRECNDADAESASNTEQLLRLHPRTYFIALAW